MDVNELRALVTLTGFVLFLVLVVRTWSRRSQPAHEAAAMLPFQEDQAATDGAEQRGVQS